MLTDWKIDPALIEEELKRSQKPNEAVCLGCAAKVELVSVVYPVLHELAAWIRQNTPHICLQPRDDVYRFPTDGTYQVHRGAYAIRDLLAGDTARVTEDVAKFKPTGVVLLANFLPYPPDEGKKKIYASMLSFYRAAARANHPFTVGKGHTIQIAKSPDQEYLVVDYLVASGSKRIGVANNDTISNIDPNLMYSSWIGAFVALHNALNDLFLCGVYRDITIFPTVDVRDPADAEPIRRALQMYEQRYGFKIVGREPLGFRTKSMGATVVGVTDREIPINQQLQPGQVLIATRPIGDLAPLTEILIRQALEEDVSDLQPLRRRVLDLMLTPNIEAAKIIEKYLPLKGEPFDPQRHITACRDMSGPGVLALEELAEDSQTDIYLHTIRLHDERIANVDMPNPTSGTNGAIIIAALPKLAERIQKDLRAVGYEPWVMGHVLERGRGRIVINEELARYRFIKGLSGSIFSNCTFSKARPFEFLKLGSH